MPRDAKESVSMIDDPHEFRIARLEEHVSELRTGQAELKGDVSKVAMQLEQGFGKLAERLDLTVKPLATTLAAHIQEDAISKVKISELEDVIAPLDAAHKARSERWAFWKKTFGGLMLGGASIGMKELVVWLVHFFR